MDGWVCVGGGDFDVGGCVGVGVSSSGVEAGGDCSGGGWVGVFVDFVWMGKATDETTPTNPHRPPSQKPHNRRWRRSSRRTRRKSRSRWKRPFWPAISPSPSCGGWRWRTTRRYVFICVCMGECGWRLNKSTHTPHPALRSKGIATLKTHTHIHTHTHTHTPPKNTHQQVKVALETVRNPARYNEILRGPKSKPPAASSGADATKGAYTVSYISPFWPPRVVAPHTRRLPPAHN